MTQDDKKKAAAKAALQYVEDGQILGVGTGSTVNYFIDDLKDIKDRIKAAVSSSIRSAERLKALGIPVLSLNEVGTFDIYVDGADEINPAREMISQRTALDPFALSMFMLSFSTIVPSASQTSPGMLYVLVIPNSLLKNCGIPCKPHVSREPNSTISVENILTY